MTRRSLFAVILVVLGACQDKDDATDCALVDCAFQSFTIKLLGPEGNNLITNGTYDPKDITVTKNGKLLFTGSSSMDSITFEIQGKVGLNTYEIQLSPTETDTLVLSLSGENIRKGCCGFDFPIDSVLYNGTAQETITEGDVYFMTLTVFK